MRTNLIVILVLALAVLALATLGVLLLTSRGGHSGSHDFTWYATFFVALVLCNVGSIRLREGGHRRARRIWLVCLPIWFMILIAGAIILIGVKGPHRTTASDIFLKFGQYLILAPCVVPLPLALYLDRRQNKSTPRTTIANAR